MKVKPSCIIKSSKQQNKVSSLPTFLTTLIHYGSTKAHSVGKLTPSLAGSKFIVLSCVFRHPSSSISSADQLPANRKSTTLSACLLS